LLAASVALLAFTSQPHLHRIVPLDKPPAALADRVATLALDLGYRDPVADRMWSYELDESYLDWEGDPLRGNARWERLRTGQPATFKFWYRQSPAPFLPLGWPHADRSRENPPTTAEGMVTVVTDPRGRLVEFRGVAPAASTPAVPLPGDAQPWRTLFAAAGLEMARFTPAPPEWTPPVPADGRLAWRGTLADHPDLPVRIEAASMGGRPVYFSLAAPWDRAPTAQPEALAGSQVAAAMLVALVIVIVIAGAGWRVRRNLALGRVDRRGALTVAAAAGLATLAANLLRGGWSWTIQGTTGAALTMAMGGVFTGSVLWVCYVALEPFVRRHKPHLLVSWTRLLTGGIADPLVGRDVLLGALLGVGSAGSLWISGWLKVWWSHPLPPNHYVIADTVGAMTLAASVVCGVLVWSLFLNLAVLVFLVVARRIVRREWLAILVFGLVGVSVEVLLYARSAPAIFGAVMNWTFSLWALSRLGLTAGVVGLFVFRVLVAFPITSDPSAAYAPNAWLAMCVVLALGAYGWWASSRAWIRRGTQTGDD
jgi:serine/threonine-protein kinase